MVFRSVPLRLPRSFESQANLSVVVVLVVISVGVSFRWTGLSLRGAHFVALGEEGFATKEIPTLWFELYELRSDHIKKSRTL